MNRLNIKQSTHDRAELLTLAVLMCGVASLALSDFVSPVYWSLPVIAAALRLWKGPAFHLSEMQASFIGWAGFVWVGFELLMGRALVVAFTDFLLILALAVVVEAATARNHLHRMLVGFFLLLGAAVLTDSMLFVLPLLAMMWFLWRAAACLYGLNCPGGDLPLTPASNDLGWMFGMAVLAALLFVLLPRFEFQSLLQAMQPRMQTSGFSDQVQLGDFARQLDETVVMRIEATDAEYAAQNFKRDIEGRYWRGVALSRFTGRGWQRMPSQSRQLASGLSSHQSALNLSQANGFTVAVYREASDHAYVHLPDGLLRIDALPEAARIDAAGALAFNKAPGRRLRLLMQLGHSATRLDLRPPLRWEWDQSLIPAALHDWLRNISRNVAGEAATSRLKLQTAASELRSWTYDLNVAVDAADPIRSFLDQKKGHCELFATTLALAARSLGFASRVVNGYRAGEWNENGSFLLMRQKHAHSWTEIWLDGRWQRMDVTPSARWQMFNAPSRLLQEAWESLKLSWYRYILDFQDSDRGAFFSGLLQAIKVYSQALLMAAGVLAALMLSWRYRQRLWLWRLSWWPGRAPELWPLLDRWLLKRGVKRLPYQPLRNIAVPDGIGVDGWQTFLHAWEMQAYGSQPLWQRRDLKRHLRALL